MGHRLGTLSYFIYFNNLPFAFYETILPWFAINYIDMGEVNHSKRFIQCFLASVYDILLSRLRSLLKKPLPCTGKPSPFVIYFLFYFLLFISLVKFLGRGQKHTLGEYIDYPRQSNQKLDFEMDIPMSFLSGRKTLRYPAARYFVRHCLHASKSLNVFIVYH